MQTSRNGFGHRRGNPNDHEEPRADPLSARTHEKSRNSVATDYHLSEAFRESLAQYRNRNSFNVGDSPAPLRPEPRSPVQEQKTMVNLRNTLSALQFKIESAKRELKGRGGVGKNVIHEEDEDEEIRALGLHSIAESSISHKVEESTINLQSQTKLLLCMRNQMDLSRVKGYYRSELAKGFQGTNEQALEHLNISWKIFRTVHKISQPSPQHIAALRVQLPLHPQDMFKKTLVLDLDETIIHCDEQQHSPKDISIPLEFDNNQIGQAFLSIRPYAISFLKKMAKKFEIVAFTASHQSYADVVLDEIDPERELIRHRIYRENCVEIHPNIFAKDLRIFNRELKDIVLVDNAPYSYLYQLDNAIPILPYYWGDDNQLLQLEKYLEEVNRSQDVREVNRRYFQLHRYVEFEEAEEVARQLYFSQE